MAVKEKKPPSEKKFLHPTAGEVIQDPRYLAIRWSAAANADNKATLLKELGLELVTSPSRQERPAIQVNQTEGLSWVSSNGKKITNTTMGSLENSELVEWAAPALVAGKETDKETGLPANMFVVNPTRFYVKQDAVDAVGGVSALATNLTPDSQRPSRLPGWVAVQVNNASSAEGNTSLEASQQAQATVKSKSTVSAGDIVRYENIPFLSPVCQSHRCRVPVGEFTPNDPMFAQQWGLQRIEVPRAWEIARGSPNITVAVIDEGVELGHPDLLLHPMSWNASTDTPDGSPTGNHGTACAGIIGARFDNGQGVAGVAAGVRIMAIATATWADVDIAEGLYFAADNGARVVSMSFGVYASWNFWDFDIVRNGLQYAYSQGLVLVAASGNEDQAISRFPGSDARTLCVGGSNRSDERKRRNDSSSESWWGACYGPDLDVVAPCLEIPTTDRLGTAGYSNDDYTGGFNGTSSATPHVAGLAGLILSLRPNLTNVEVRNIIEITCDKISPALYSYGHINSKPSGTWNDEVGYGRVNAERALLAACAHDTADKGECSGCGDECIEPTPAECRSPEPVPWLPNNRCMYFYETRTFDQFALTHQQRLQIRVTYQHMLCLRGRQQGPLLYTTTLLPGEEVRLYEYDRYRRTRAETQRVSVHTSFRQTLSSLSQSRRSLSASAYSEVLNNIRTHSDTSVSAGGGLAGFFGAPKVSGEFGVDTETSMASGASVRVASEQFTQLAITASQTMEAERSLVISSFEDEEHRSATSRTLKNHNHCYAVSYFVRRVNELYEASSRIEAVEWRAGDNGQWRSVDDLDDVSDALRKILSELLRQAPRIGEVVRDKRPITIPTDGTLYESELAHCSSCEPVRSAEELVRLEQERAESRKACLETELLALELKRRQQLARADKAVALPLQAWPFQVRQTQTAAEETDNTD